MRARRSLRASITPKPRMGRPPARPGDDALNALRRLAAVAAATAPRHLLRLYVTGASPGSMRAIEQVRRVCEAHLSGRYDLEVIDLYQLPALARDDQIIATPTLVRVLPPPIRSLIGDLSKLEGVLFGMDVRETSS